MRSLTEMEGAIPMQATPAEIDALLRLQQIDLDILHQEKQLEDLGCGPASGRL